MAGTSGAGTIGQISGFANAYSVPLNFVSIPNGTGFLGAYQLTQKRPARICFDFRAVFIPIFPIPQVECNYTLCYNVQVNSTGGGVVVAGAGSVAFGGVLSSPTLTVR